MSSFRKKADLFHRSFDSGTCKTSLKLVISRLKLLKNKRAQQASVLKREVAQLLEAGHEERARVKVEHVIREEKVMSAYELIELYCEIIVGRLPIIESQKVCPIDLKEAVSSVIFAQPRCADLTELKDVRKHLTHKYGKDFANAAVEVRPGCGVSPLIVEKLSAKSPNIETKVKVLSAIAAEHGVDWKPKSFEDQLEKPTEDFLNGPSSFQSATKLASESAKPEFIVQIVPKQESVSNPIIHQASSTRGNTNVGSSSVDVPMNSRHEGRASEPKLNETEIVYAQSEEKRTTLHQQNWSLNFKDAASAVEAAAKSAEMASLAARAAVNLASCGNVPRQQATISDYTPSKVSLESKQPEPIVSHPVQIDGRIQSTYKESLRSEGPQQGGSVKDDLKGKPKKEDYDRNNNKSHGITSRSSSTFVNDDGRSDDMLGKVDVTLREKNSSGHVAFEQSKLNEKVMKNDVEIRDDRMMRIHHQYSRSEDQEVQEATKSTVAEELERNFERFEREGSFQRTATPQPSSKFVHDMRSSNRATASLPSPISVDDNTKEGAKIQDALDIVSHHTSEHAAIQRNSQKEKNEEHDDDDRSSRSTSNRSISSSFHSASQIVMKADIHPEINIFAERNSSLPSPVFVDDNAKAGSKIQDALDVVSCHTSEQAAIQRNLQKEKNEKHDDDDRSFRSTSNRSISSSFHPTSHMDMQADLHLETNLPRSDSRSRKTLYDDDGYQWNNREQDDHMDSSSDKAAVPNFWRDGGNVHKEDAKGRHGDFSFATSPFEDEEVESLQSGKDSNNFMSKFGVGDGLQTCHRQDSFSHLSKPAFDDDDADDGTRIDFENIESNSEIKSDKRESGYFPLHLSPGLSGFQENDLTAEDISVADDVKSSDVAFVNFDVYDDSNENSHSHDEFAIFQDRNREKVGSLPSKQIATVESPSLHQPEQELQQSLLHDKEGKTAKILSQDFSGIKKLSPPPGRRLNDPRKQSVLKVWGHSEISTMEVTPDKRADLPSSNIKDPESEQGLRLGYKTGGLRNKAPLGPPYSRRPVSEEGLSYKEMTSDTSPVAEKLDESKRHTSVLNLELNYQKSTDQNPQFDSPRPRSRISTPDSDDSNSGSPQLRQGHSGGGISYMSKHSSKTAENEQIAFRLPKILAPDEGFDQKSEQRSQIDASEDYPTSVLSRKNRRGRKNLEVAEETSVTAFDESSRLEISGPEFPDEEPRSRNKNERGSRRSSSSYDATASEETSPLPQHSAVGSSRRTRGFTVDSSRDKLPGKETPVQVVLSRGETRIDSRSSVSSSDPETNEEMDPWPGHPAASGGARGGLRRTRGQDVEPPRDEFSGRELSGQRLVSRDNDERAFRSSIPSNDARIEEQMDPQPERPAASGAARGGSRRRRGKAVEPPEDEFSGKELSGRRSVSGDNDERTSKSYIPSKDAGIDEQIDPQLQPSVVSWGDKVISRRMRVSTVEQSKQELMGQDFTERLPNFRDRNRRGFVSSVPDRDREIEEEMDQQQQPPVASAGAKVGSRRTRGLSWESKVGVPEKDLDESNDPEVKTKPHSKLSSSILSTEKHSTPVPETKDLNPQKELVKSLPRYVSMQTVSSELEIKESLKQSSSAPGKISTQKVDEKAIQTRASEQQPPITPTRDSQQKKPLSVPQADLVITTSPDSKEEPRSTATSSVEKSKGSSHVHPKMPSDYDTFAANFQSLRANTRRK